MILFLAICTHKIKHENFKDTKTKLIHCYLDHDLGTVVLFIRGYESAATAVIAATLLALPGTWQMVLFTLKVFSILLNECFPTA